MSPLPATIGFTARPDFLAKASARIRRIPLSCVVVVVRMMSSFGSIGCAITGAARLANAAKHAKARKLAKRFIWQAPAHSRLLKGRSAKYPKLRPTQQVHELAATKRT